MNVVRTILLVAFIIVCILGILLVLVQNEDNNGMGGVFGGGQSAAFGSHSASVLSKTTAVLVGLFFVLAFGLALVNKSSTKRVDLSAAALEQSADSTDTGATAAGNWLDDVE